MSVTRVREKAAASLCIFILCRSLGSLHNNMAEQPFYVPRLTRELMNLGDFSSLFSHKLRLRLSVLGRKA